MDWKELGIEIAKRGAPLLGAALGGPAGMAIGAAVAAGLNAEDNTPEAIAIAIQTNPESAIRLLEIQTTHSAELGRLAVARLEAENADRADARARDIQVRTLSKKDARSEDPLVWIAFSGVVGCVLLAAFGNLTDAAFGLVATLGGIFLNKLGTVYDFRYGSSQGSKDKDTRDAIAAAKEYA